LYYQLLSPVVSLRRASTLGGSNIVCCGGRSVWLTGIYYGIIKRCIHLVHSLQYTVPVPPRHLNFAGCKIIKFLFSY